MITEILHQVLGCIQRESAEDDHEDPGDRQNGRDHLAARKGLFQEYRREDDLVDRARLVEDRRDARLCVLHARNPEYQREKRSKDSTGDHVLPGRVGPEVGEDALPRGKKQSYGEHGDERAYLAR